MNLLTLVHFLVIICFLVLYKRIHISTFSFFIRLIGEKALEYGNDADVVETYRHFVAAVAEMTYKLSFVMLTMISVKNLFTQGVNLPVIVFIAVSCAYVFSVILFWGIIWQTTKHPWTYGSWYRFIVRNLPS